MQISDMLRQYNRNLSNSSTEELKGATGMQKLVSTVKELQNGNIFEGTVSAVKGGKVTLALGNGQTITAQMDGKVNLSIGTPMFFQVKNNDGNTVSICPYLIEGNTGNPILLNALTAAGIPVNERNLFMADTMMKEQLPIDKQSILDMVKVANLNPDVSVKTVVEMVKLGIPVSKAMAMQYENYLGERQSILKEVNQAMNDLAAVAGKKELPPEVSVRLNQEIVDTLLAGKGGEKTDIAKNSEVLSDGQVANPSGRPQPGGLFTAGVLATQQEANVGQNAGVNQSQSELLQMAGQTAEAVTVSGQADAQPANMEAAAEGANLQLINPQSGDMATAGEAGGMLTDVSGMPSEGARSADASTEAGQLTESAQNVNEQANASQPANGAGTLGQLLSEEGLQNLNKLLQNVPTLVESQELFPGAEEIFVDTMQEESGRLAAQTEAALAERQSTPSLDANMTVEQFLKAVKLGLAKQQDFGFAGVQKLFASKEYQSLLKNIMEQEWLLKPQELTTGNKINELYEHLDHQLHQLESAMHRAGMATEAFSQTVTSVHNNIEFMNLINQTYTYVQLPLKLSNQNANSELYVYTNKKNLKDPEAEVTAFLHLDMEHLGATDVSVKLQKKHVKTNFYFSDDASYEVVKQYLPMLEEKLAKKGYICTLTVNQDGKEMNFVEDFLRKDQPQVGTLHRYSFDVRT